MAIYKVIDELAGDVQYFEDLKEANRETVDIQGILIKVDDNGEEIVLRDLSDF